MKTITLKVEDSINEKLLWLLEHFPPGAITIVETGEYLSDDEYLRSINGMVSSIKDARNGSIDKSVPLEDLDW